MEKPKSVAAYFKKLPPEQREPLKKLRTRSPPQRPKPRKRSRTACRGSYSGGLEGVLPLLDSDRVAAYQHH